MEGRYYDYSHKLWSFPNCCWEDMKCFLDSQKYTYKCIKAQNYVTVTKNPDSLHLKFGGFQEDFKIFNSIRGAAYNRNISKYVIPIDQEKVVLEILAGKGFTCTIIKNNEIKFIEDNEDFPEGMFPKESKDSTLLESDQEDIEEGDGDLENSEYTYKFLRF